MKLGNFAKAFAPIIAVVMAAGVSGCDASNIKLNGEEGKPLAELDLTGAAPNELVLLGPDEVRVTTGDKLAITVEGDDALKDQMRFTLKDGALGIRRNAALRGEQLRADLVRRVGVAGQLLTPYALHCPSTSRHCPNWLNWHSFINWRCRSI